MNFVMFFIEISQNNIQSYENTYPNKKNNVIQRNDIY
ncbi:hypothetical protein ABID42_000711 [Arcicella rosea]